MPCSTLNGLTIDYCKDGRGGIDKLWIVDAAESAINYDVADITAGAIPFGDISLGITPLNATLTAFESYELYKELSSVSEAGTFEPLAGTGFQTATVTAVFLKMSAATQAELNQLAKSRRLCIIVKDNNGKYWLVGNNRGAVLTASSSASGTAWNDQNSTTMTFTGVHESAMLQITGLTA
jgi:hypothetical protein